MWRSRALSAALLVALLACREALRSPNTLKMGPRLQAIEVVQTHPETGDSELVALTDVAYELGAWGEGRVLLIDPHERTLLGSYYTAQANPQALLAVEGGFICLQGGSLSLGERPSATHGGLSYHPLSAPFSGARDLSWLSDPLSSGYLITALEATRSDDAPARPPLLMSSGIDGVVWFLKDWSERAEAAAPPPPLDPLPASLTRYAAPDQLGLGSLVAWRQGPLVIDFNSDQLSLIKPDGSVAPCQPELGRFPEVMEGAQTPAVSADRLYVSFGLSGELSSFNLSEIDWSDPNCSLSSEPFSPALGAVPNDLIVTEDKLYVLHSGEQDVWVYELASRRLVQRWQLPDDSHPWHMVRAQLNGEERLLITAWLSGELLSLDPLSGAVETLISAETLSAPTARFCERPEELTEASERPILITDSRTFSWPKLAQDSTGAAAQMIDLPSAAPQLALSFTGASAALLIEVKRTSDSNWRSLTTLELITQEQLSASSETPRLRAADHVLVLSSTDSAASLTDLEPCERFQPRPETIRLTLPPGLAEGQGGIQLRVSKLRGGQAPSLIDVVYRAW